jgi:voltage-gated potassium channel Kch
MAVIVLATAAVVVGSGALMRLIDHKEYASVWTGMWWAMQTVTTVGYGDVTPADPNGRIVATFVMLVGIAFLAIVTASITSTFVEIAGREQRRTESRKDAELEAHLAAIQGELTATRAQLERIETRLTAGGDEGAAR